jgi:hypothetical protein
MLGGHKSNEFQDMDAKESLLGGMSTAVVIWWIP